MFPMTRASADAGRCKASGPGRTATSKEKVTVGDIINLNRARKIRERAEAKRTAEANRLRFGRTRAERDASKAQQARDAARLDGHKRDDDA